MNGRDDSKGQEGGDDQQKQMEQTLEPDRKAAEQMGIGVASQQEELEKEHTGGPDFGCAAEPRGQEAAQEGLNLKEQEGP